MNISEIGNKIYYAGVNNRTAELFEELWPIPQGVSYNSYVVVGDKIALIDTVPACYCIKFLHRIAAIIGDRPIDYLVINHMEPDHSGAIQIIRQRYPEIKIVGNNKTAEMIAGYYGITDGFLTIKDGDTIDLGAGKSLRFILTPMVHWPETMMTYMESGRFLFAGDAFGCFGALNGG
ncbi:MAG: FprA family A-type flavoprotein, partial [Bacteroidales bacterium]|nr:FprA family A-type flavoprotein [Bacteroidales bacterium]